MEPDQPHQSRAEIKQDATDARQLATDERQLATDERQTVSNDVLQEMVGSLAVTVDKISVNVDRMIGDSEKTREAMGKLSISNTTLASRNRQKNFVIGTLVLLVASTALFGWRLQAQGTCFANWANRSTDRTGTLTKLSSARNLALRKSVDAEHEALHYALTHPNGTPAQAAHEIRLLGMWDDRTSDFQGADDAYSKALTANPVPTSPKFDCTAF